MYDIYELEEYYNDGKIGLFVKTRQCSEEFFDDRAENEEARRLGHPLSPVQEVRRSPRGYLLEINLRAALNSFLLSLRHHIVELL